MANASKLYVARWENVAVIIDATRWHCFNLGAPVSAKGTGETAERRTGRGRPSCKTATCTCNVYPVILYCFEGNYLVICDCWH